MTPVKPLIYIAGPYSHPDPVANTHAAVRHGLMLRESYDVAVIIPHLSLVAQLVGPRNDEFWYNLDLDVLAHCDGLVRIPGASRGADREVIVADELGIPVFHISDGYHQLERWLDSLGLRVLDLRSDVS